MRRSSARTFGIVALGLLWAALAVPGCSPFHSCAESRTCPSPVTDKGSAGEAGSVENSAPGSPSAGAGAGAGAGGAVEAGGQAGDTENAGEPEANGDVDGGAGGMGGADGDLGNFEKPDGVDCNQGTECVTGACTTFFRDADADGYGSQIAVDAAAFCGTSPPVGYAAKATDCCDSDKNVKPGQSSFFPASNGCNSFDYNCNGMEDLDPQQKHVAVESCEVSTKSCNVTAGWVGMQETACGEDFYWRAGTCRYITSTGSCTFDRTVEVVRCR